MSIDRIDVNAGYSCGSCAECSAKGSSLNLRWATDQDQARNKRNTRYVTINGVRKCAAEWVEELGVERTTFYRKAKEGTL